MSKPEMTSRRSAGAFLDGFRLAAGLLATRPELPLPESITASQPEHSLEDGPVRRLHLSFTLPGCLSEELAESAVTAWATALNVDLEREDGHHSTHFRYINFAAWGFHENASLVVRCTARVALVPAEVSA